MTEERIEICAVDVAGIGVNSADRMLMLPEFPRPGSKMELRGAEKHLGDQVASAMIACQSWGLNTRYVGKVGSDSVGEAHAREFERAGVEAHLVRVGNCRSQNSVILVDQRTA
jgi:sulfofructose kinase